MPRPAMIAYVPLGWALWILTVLAPVGTSWASAPCTDSIDGLRALVADRAFPMTWYETSMDDGKPLVLSLLERNGRLVLQFLKTGEGLWAEGTTTVCVEGTEVEARIAADQVQLGPAASLATQLAFANGGRFLLTRHGTDQLRVRTTGWSGTFTARPLKRP